MGVGKVEIQIGALVLEGVSRADGRRIGEAVKSELARLVRERGVGEVARARTHVTAMSASSFAVAPDAAPRTIGVSVARSLHSALKTRVSAGRGPARNGSTSRR